MESQLTNTCQICGRAIKAKSGVVAHHGYTRPDSGWQTSSCVGARHLPYEESNDVLPSSIDRLSDYIMTQETRLAEFTNNPPETLVIQSRSSYRQNITVSKPEGFTKDTRPSHRTNQYDTEFFSVIYRIESDIRNSKKFLEYLQDRLDKWVKVR